VSCHNGTLGFLGGDFALCEILSPIPPHFNIYYAGWSSQSLINKAVEAPFVDMHHPKGDIKKRAYAPVIVDGSFTITQGCRVITKVIDFLFGWIWEHRFSTEVICNYIDIPYYYSVFTEGCTDHGSSGSALLNRNSNVVGTCSGFGEFFAKFPNNYLYQGVKNGLNPSNSWSVDQVGIDGRQISCYSSLNLTGNPTSDDGRAYYFPANHYQSDNHIKLSAATTITVNNTVIVDGSDYEFTAGESITLGSGFEVEAGAKATFSIAPCTPHREGVFKPDIGAILSSIELPKYKEFKAEQYLDAGAIGLSVYPNPAGARMLFELARVANACNWIVVWDEELQNIFRVLQ
jgi:hypothetical protein